jgi:tetratricopeptide (TPR) repeat protein
VRAGRNEGIWTAAVLGCFAALFPSAEAVADTAWIPEPLEGWAAGLKPLHSSRIHEALHWFLARQRQSGDEVCGAYFPALVYAAFDLDGIPGKVQDARSREWAERGIEAGQQLLDSGDADAGTRYCLGAMYGLRATDRMERSKYLGAALDGKRARRVMLDLFTDEPDFVDCRFWLGSYDYFADVLPTFFKFFRSLFFFPSGDKEMGLAALEQVGRHGRLDRFNALWILYRLYDNYENEPWKGLGALERLQATYPDFIDARLALAWYQAVLRRPPDRALGIELHRQALERVGAIGGVAGRRLDRRVNLSLAEAYINDLQPESAVEVLREVLASVRGVEREELRAATVMARALNYSGSHDAAQQLLADARRRYSASPFLDELEKATTDFDSGSSRIFRGVISAWRAGREGQLAEAQSAFGSLLAERVAPGLIHFGMAEMYFETGRHAEAELHFRRVLETEIERPAFVVPWAHLRLGNLLDLNGKRTLARASYRKAEGANDEHVRSAAKRFLKFPYTGKAGVRLL